MHQKKQPSSSSIRRLVYRTYRRSALIPIFTVELALILLYFAVNQYTNTCNRNFQMSEVRLVSEALANSAATHISQQLISAEYEVILLQSEHESFFQLHNMQPSLVQNVKTSPTFATSENGVYYKVDDNGGSCLFYGVLTEQTKATRSKALQSEVLDDQLKACVQNNPIIVAAALMTWDDMFRRFPFLPNVHEAFPPDIKVEGLNFYYLADSLHNPGRGTQWTSPYLDPAGLGWMISCCAPVYNENDFLEGVAIADVPFEHLINHILDLDFPWSSASMLVTSTGEVIAIPPFLEPVLELKELKSAFYSEETTQIIVQPEHFNLSKLPNPETAKQLSTIFTHEIVQSELEINDTNYLIMQSFVPDADLRLFTFIDKDDLFAPINQQAEFTHRIGFAIILIMILFYLLFFTYLLRQSNALANRISDPITRMSKAATRFALDHAVFQPVSTQIQEIDSLGSSMNTTQTAQREAYQHITELNRSYSRFVPSEILAHIGRSSILNVKLADQVAKSMAVLCIDIRRFTQLSESMNPEECFAFINRYTQRMAPLVRRHGGFIDKYIGDGILALFDSPVQALNAVSAMLDSIDSLNEELIQEGRAPIEIGAGLHFGALMLGIIGDKMRMEGTVISDTVNLADQIQELNKLYGTTLLISEEVLHLIDLPDDLASRKMGEVYTVGRHGLLTLHEVFQAKTLKGQRLLAIDGTFQAALKHYRVGQIEDALGLFHTCFRENMKDRASLYYCKHCESLIKSGLAENWEGVTKVGLPF